MTNATRPSMARVAFCASDNFVVGGDRLWYVDCECNAYMPEWSFENRGVKYWSRTPELEDYLRKHDLQ